MALNHSEMQVLKMFASVFAVLWVCHGLHLQGTQNPGCMGFVSVGLFACKVGAQSHYVPIFQGTFQWKVFVPN